MGQSRTRLQKLISTHPHCIFCGGTAATTSVEHMPSRILFDNKWRPKGLEFPSCQQCQEATRKIELVIALFTRFYPPHANSDQEAEFQKVLEGAENNNPGLLAEIQIDSDTVLKQIGSDADKLPERDFISLEGPIAQHALRQFARKLALALHFELKGRAAPKGARLWIEYHTNFTAVIDGMPDDFLKNLGTDQTLRMGRQHVFEQFRYQNGEIIDSDITLHMARFRDSFSMLLVVYPTLDEMTALDREDTISLVFTHP